MTFDPYVKFPVLRSNGSQVRPWKQNMDRHGETSIPTSTVCVCGGGGGVCLKPVSHVQFESIYRQNIRDSKIKTCFARVQNIVGKGENAGN